MVRLGIVTLSPSDLSPEAQGIVLSLSNGVMPKVVWAIYHLDKMLVFYLTADEAFAALKYLIQCIEDDLTPNFALVGENLILAKNAAEAITAKPNDERSPTKARKKLNI